VTLKDKVRIVRSVAQRPMSATQLLWKHRRTLKYLASKGSYKALRNHIFVTYFIRGEDCGRGILDPIWKIWGNAPFLWDLELEVTTSCYLRCIMCEHTYWPDKSYLNQNMSLEAFKNLVDSIPNLRWINITGEGSGPLNPEFFEMIRHCKARGIYVDFSHDFFRLSEERMRDLVNWGVDRIYWSIDGATKETYEKIRVGSNFDTVKTNVQKLVQIKKELGSPLPEICFRFCFFKENVHEVTELPDFLASLVDEVKDYGDDPSINLVALLEFKETKDWAVEISKDDVDYTDMRSRKLGFTNYWSHITHVEENKAPMDYCTFWSEPYVMITGHVVPCCAVLMSNRRPELEKLAFGNIYEQPLKSIWDSNIYKKFRKTVVNPKAPVPRVCYGCRAFNTKERARKYGIVDNDGTVRYE